MATKPKTPAKPATKTTRPAPIADQAAGDPYPLSRVATPAQVTAAGIRNGMSADEIERRLADSGMKP